MTWVPNKKDVRADGSKKGSGWLGVQARPDGTDSTEISIGVDFDGEEVDIPTMVPTLNKDEINHLLTTDPKKLDFDSPVGKEIMRKAVEHARTRKGEGKSPFADEQESKAATAARAVHNDEEESAAMHEAFQPRGRK